MLWPWLMSHKLMQPRAFWRMCFLLVTPPPHPQEEKELVLASLAGRAFGTWQFLFFVWVLFQSGNTSYLIFFCLNRSISTSKECPASEFTQSKTLSGLCGLVVLHLCMRVTEPCWIGLKQMSTLWKLEQQLERELSAFWGESPHLTPNGLII